MVKKTMYVFWGGMLTLCAAFGFLPVSAGAARGAMITLAVLSFIPPTVIVTLSSREGASADLWRIRNLSIASLSLTLAALLANFATLAAPEWAGNALYAILIIVSSPMICGQYWILSLTLWAALLWTCIILLKKRK